MNGRIKWIYTKRRNIFQELIRASGNLKGSDGKGATECGGGGRDIDRGKWQPLESGNPRRAFPTTNVCYQDQLNASENAVLRGHNGKSILPPPTFLSPKRDPSTALSDRRNFVSANLVRTSHLPFISFRGNRVSSSTIVAKWVNDQFSDRRYTSRFNCETTSRHNIPRTYISQTLRGVKETSLSWRATKRNISGRNVHVQLLRRRGIWMNTFPPK